MSQTRISPTGLAHLEGDQSWPLPVEDVDMNGKPAASNETDAPEFNFPDYTRSYKIKGPIHDAPGGPDSIRGYVISTSTANDGLGSEVQGINGFHSPDSVNPWTGPGMHQQSPQETTQIPLTNFNTGLLFQAAAPAAQHLTVTKNLLIPGENGNSNPSLFNSLPRSFSPGRVIPDVSEQGNRKQSVPEIHPNIAEISPIESSGWEKANNVTNSNGSYSTLPSAKSSSNNSNSASKPVTNYLTSFSVPKPFTPMASSGTTATFQPVRFSSTVTPVSGQDNSLSLYGQKVINLNDPTNADSARAATLTSPVPVLQQLPTNTQDTPVLKPLPTPAFVPQTTNFTARPYKPPQATLISSGDSSESASKNVGSHLDDHFQKRDVVDTETRPTHSISSSAQQQQLYKAVPIVSVPVADTSYSQDTSTAKPNVPPPPPPAPPFQQQLPVVSRGPAKQPPIEKPPMSASDLILKSASASGPKPFSYGVDLTELNKKIAPPTAPKPKQQGEQERSIGVKYDTLGKTDRERKNSTELLDGSNLVVGTGFPASSIKKRSVGHIQPDYLTSRQLEPRSEVDESPINVNMGVDPKKQSKSFKLLQWMTETDQDDPNELYQKPTKKSKDPELRHNADDDEMRFSGLNPKTEIPSKTFNNLQRKSSQDTTASSDKATLEVVQDNNQDPLLRYTGAGVPSPSFRVLQTWAESDPHPISDKTHVHEPESTEEGSPEDGQAIVNMRYMGASIPSKVFQVLRQSLEDDLSEEKTFSRDEDSKKEIETTDPSVSDF